MKFSIVVPVYNRPDELKELLESLTKQSYTDFEVIIVEDGSSLKSDEVVASYQNQLEIRYFFKENTGPGGSRNYGFARAKGDYFIIFDSDCFIPENYLEIVKNQIKLRKLDAYGGPDTWHPTFTNVQIAISYAMTSFFSTGGIRGKKKQMGGYQARSFNMGFSREVYEATGGFSNLRISEDIDLSKRIADKGFRLELISEAFVYHKRRTNFKQFFRQTHSFGKGRMNIGKLQSGQIKLVHLLPSGFVLFCFALLITPWISLELFFFQLLLFGLYFVMILTDSINQTKRPIVGFLSVVAVTTQLLGYGTGFLKGLFAKKNTGKKITQN